MSLNGPVGASAIHNCLDMQKMFMPPGAWSAGSPDAAYDHLAELYALQSRRTIGLGHGMWRSYYERWAEMTLEIAGSEIIELASPLDDTTRLPAASISRTWLANRWQRGPRPLQEGAGVQVQAACNARSLASLSPRELSASSVADSSLRVSRNRGKASLSPNCSAQAISVP